MSRQASTLVAETRKYDAAMAAASRTWLMSVTGVRQASTLDSETRKYDAAMAAAMEETLRASKESLSSVLEAKRAMHDRIAAAERRAIRAEHAAKKVRMSVP